MKELTSGFRMNVNSTHDDLLQTYWRADWGYTWYELHDFAIVGIATPASSVRGGYPPTLFPSKRWWPNTWFAGGGIELFSPRRH